MKLDVKKGDRVLVTCALPYVNNIPHIGNIVGSHLPGDIFTRFCRLYGLDAIYIGGSDEHGTPIVVAAEKIGVTPKKLSTKLYRVHKEIYNWLNIKYDNFSRTSRKIHTETTQHFFKKIFRNGFISEEEMLLPYCPKCERTLPDRYVEGTCPVCGSIARGDQCEKCSTLLNPSELREPYCIVCHSTPVFKKFKHLFLDLDKLSPKIKEWIKNNKIMKESVKNLALGWIKEGLKPRSITRDMKWGIPVPLKGYKKKVFYVWFDAPIGYISSTKEWAKKNSKDWRNYWKKGKKVKIIHFIGKDNIPFHTIWWGGMLLANGTYELPYNVAGLQFCNYEGQKISKSKGVGVFCENLSRSGVSSDTWRYYLTHIIPENKDTEWKWKEFQDRVNNELVANIGNLFYRLMSFINKNFKQGIKKPTKFEKKDEKILSLCERKKEKIFEKIWEINIRDALQEILSISSSINKYFQDSEPWKLIKENKKECEKKLYVCANACKDLSILLYPYLPETMKKIHKILSITPTWDEIGRKLKSVKFEKPEILFKKIDDNEIKKIKEKVEKSKTIEEYFGKRGRDGMITFDDFAKMDLRIGRIIEAEEIKGSDKLIKLTIELNENEKRTIVAGIKKYYSPKDLKNKQIVFIKNLEPRRIMGIESQGMLLAAFDKSKDKLSLIIPDKKVENGIKLS